MDSNVFFINNVTQQAISLVYSKKYWTIQQFFVYDVNIVKRRAWHCQNFNYSDTISKACVFLILTLKLIIIMCVSLSVYYLFSVSTIRLLPLRVCPNTLLKIKLNVTYTLIEYCNGFFFELWVDGLCLVLCYVGLDLCWIKYGMVLTVDYSCLNVLCFSLYLYTNVYILFCSKIAKYSSIHQPY